MERSRVTRYLRIAVTALSLTACVLFVALWVRSYSWTDISTKWNVASNQGRLIKFRTIDLITIEARDPYIYTHPFGFISIGTRRVEFTQAYPGSALPFSAVVIPALALASIPWLPWRFSLRTLLIATTLVAVALRIIAMSR